MSSSSSSIFDSKTINISLPDILLLVEVCVLYSSALITGIVVYQKTKDVIGTLSKRLIICNVLGYSLYFTMRISFVATGQ